MKRLLFSFRHRVRGWRLVALLAVFILIIAAVLYGSHSSAGSQASGQWIAAQLVAGGQPIMLDGQLEPAVSVNITAPFDGKIVKMSARTGDRVAEGAPLLEIASNDLLAELRDAEAAAIRAQQALDQALNWNSSAEMLAAQRQLSTSQKALDNAERNLVETQALYDKGIVSRNELQIAQSDISSLQTQASAAAESLAAVQEKGSALQRKLLQLDLDNRRSKLADIRDKLARASIKAPITGVVLYPAPQAHGFSAPAKEIELGSFVSAKDTLMTIGDTANLAVRANLDEFDILRVRPGLPVDLTLNSNSDVKLKGNVVRVSSQAKKSANPIEGPNRAPAFELEVLIRNISPEVHASVRIGMSVRMQIQPEAEHAALLVPLAAVVMAPDGSAQVLRRAPGAKDGMPVRIKLGKTLVGQVEVASGLTAGDEVWVVQNTAANDLGNVGHAAARPGFPGLTIADE